uniref:Lipid-binding serum glycoprotein N-terminal domain-containing protein n=1 Tax=Petromyzon marinus TaxID=7757 RepID=S4RH72_PETMA
VNQESIEVIQAVLKNTTFPSVQDNSPIPFIGTVYYSLTDLRITNTAVAKSEIVLLEGYGLSFHGKDIEIVVQGKVSYEYRSWLLSLRLSWQLEIKSRSSKYIVPSLPSSNGTFLIEPPSCHLHIDDLQLRLAKNENLGIQFLGDMLTIPIRQLLRIQVCSELRNVGKELSFRLQEQTDKLTLDDKNALDVSLLSCPLITKDYIETRHKGISTYRTKRTSFS